MLGKGYQVARISFEGIDDEPFENLDLHLNNVCQNKKVVLIIDETDKTSNNLVFLRFVGMLRDKSLEQIAGYLDSKNKDTGYLLTFDFRKDDNIGKPQAKWTEYKGKRIFDCIAGV